MERKLASVQKIINLSPIEGADRIEKATVLGWDLVVKKSEFSIGDKCAFFEIDAILPDGPDWAEFMRPRHFRVRTVRMKKVLSQGLALPLSMVGIIDDLEIDTDITELLGVKKYEPELHHAGAKFGQAKGNFPHFVKKTDEIRLQSILDVVDELKEAGPFYISTKIDGTSATYCFEDDEFCVCSRNWKKTEDDTNIYWAMAKKYKIEEILKNNKNLSIQGEIAGPAICKNRAMLPEVDLFVFNIYDIADKKLLDFDKFIEFCKENNLKTVPIESINYPESFDFSLENWLNLAKGNYENTDKPKEGIVVRPLKETYSERLKGRLSFKVINNQFLLKYDE